MFIPVLLNFIVPDLLLDRLPHIVHRNHVVQLLVNILLNFLVNLPVPNGIGVQIDLLLHQLLCYLERNLTFLLIPVLSFRVNQSQIILDLLTLHLPTHMFEPPVVVVMLIIISYRIDRNLSQSRSLIFQLNLVDSLVYYTGSHSSRRHPQHIFERYLLDSQSGLLRWDMVQPSRMFELIVFDVSPWDSGNISENRKSKSANFVDSWEMIEEKFVKNFISKKRLMISFHKLEYIDRHLVFIIVILIFKLDYLIKCYILLEIHQHRHEEHRILILFFWLFEVVFYHDCLFYLIW